VQTELRFHVSLGAKPFIYLQILWQRTTEQLIFGQVSDRSFVQQGSVSFRQSHGANRKSAGGLAAG
jgi:hypothetical protein